MATSVLPVGKGVALLGTVSLIAYAVTSVVQAQQVVMPPPDNFTAPEVTDTAALDGPRQPIFYRHDVHAGQYKMDCRYCHYTAEVAMTPGMPAVSTCMGCHLFVGGDSTSAGEIAKLRDAAANQEPIEWVEVHSLPPFVHFPHMRHTNADPPVSCQDCHGPVQEMVQVYQTSNLKMGWCLDCHKARNVSTDCTVCHY